MPGGGWWRRPLTHLHETEEAVSLGEMLFTKGKIGTFFIY
jgi:hypothetical protein